MRSEDTLIKFAYWMRWTVLHDLLAISGFPQAKLNEIHGAWGDTKNMVARRPQWRWVVLYWGVPKMVDTPKWMVYNGKSH